MGTRPFEAYLSLGASEVDGLQRARHGAQLEEVGAPGGFEPEASPEFDYPNLFHAVAKPLQSCTREPVRGVIAAQGLQGRSGGFQEKPESIVVEAWHPRELGDPEPRKMRGDGPQVLTSKEERSTLVRR